MEGDLQEEDSTREKQVNMPVIVHEASQKGSNVAKDLERLICMISKSHVLKGEGPDRGTSDL